MSGNRSTDGVTVNKVMTVITGSSISIVLAMVSYVYISDRDLARASIQSIASNVQKISDSQIISYSRQENTDARLLQVENRQNEFFDQARTYWLDPESRANRTRGSN